MKHLHSFNEDCDWYGDIQMCLSCQAKLNAWKHIYPENPFQKQNKIRKHTDVDLEIIQ